MAGALSRPVIGDCDDSQISQHLCLVRRVADRNGASHGTRFGIEDAGGVIRFVEYNEQVRGLSADREHEDDKPSQAAAPSMFHQTPEPIAWPDCRATIHARFHRSEAD